ncbi:uncharacterized protein LOC135224592 isoform X3 [Macrobrachium nipponense]|uniref:uncharacterized protein LOC135224592 isoform X3 n=1 Tax=Macrobrachium nipponense TaxID=159736 RepID=UPI0030C86FD2
MIINLERFAVASGYETAYAVFDKCQVTLCLNKNLRMGEHKCLLSQCCCGCSLRTGSLAIGIIGLVFAALHAIYGIYHGINGISQGWVNMVVGILNVILCAVLIQGIRLEKRSMIMVWVWVQSILIAINIILGVIEIILTLNFIVAILLFIIMGIAVYCVLVVRSYAISISSGTGGMA